MDEQDIQKVTEATKQAVHSAIKKGPMRVVLIIAVILVVFLFLSPFVQVGAGERGVVLNFGAVQDSVLMKDCISGCL